MNKLYFGDNLEILREIDDACIDLICTDPPFDSGRDYNAFLDDSPAQNKAFANIWAYDTTAEDTRADIEDRARVSDPYKALDECLRGYDLVLRQSVSGNKGAMRSYLAFMGPRLAEMHRVLKDTGSIYLHCDPTASHYLKGVMDAIWDQGNQRNNDLFRNEIVWHYRRPTIASKQFGKVHDVILYYTKTKNYVFNKPSQTYAGEKYIEDTDHGDVGAELVGLRSERRRSIEREIRERGASMHDVWVDIDAIADIFVERLDYPTQKPRVLYERMIEVSSNKDDLILDPFCGSGTTIDAAHTLNRQWMGIDLTILALDPIRYRLSDRHELEPFENYQIEGYPTSVQEVQKLLRDRDSREYDDISNWVVTRLGLRLTTEVVDKGYDGVGHLRVWTSRGMEETDARVITEVKAGKPTLTQLRAFCRVMKQNEAKVGIFITIEPITSGMDQEAEKMGTFEHKGLSYPRLQFWQITDEYFETPEIINTFVQLPSEWRIRSPRRSERHFLPDEDLEFEID